MKTKIKSIPLIYPIPIILAGANVHGKPNYVLIGDVGIMGLNPPLVYISSHVNHYTNIGILQNETFSINIPDTPLLGKADYCGLVSGSDVDKSVLFTNRYGELGSAPMIEECPVSLECEVVKEFCIEQRQIFVGKVAGTYVREDLVSTAEENTTLAEMTRMDPIIYGLDNLYYSIGAPIGTGYQEGQPLLTKND
jgi:flavin reductase (DIM6/NTAB) family NADH-FMN oxidoreductase RutF